MTFGPLSWTVLLITGSLFSPIQSLALGARRKPPYTHSPVIVTTQNALILSKDALGGQPHLLLGTTKVASNGVQAPPPILDSSFS